MQTFETKFGKVTLYKNETYIGHEFQHGRYWDEETLLQLKKYIGPTKNVLEIGAHCGTSTLVYSTFLTTGKVYAFEPQKKLYNLLTLNVEQNNLSDKIKIFNSALFCYSGEISMNEIDIEGGGEVVSKRYEEESHLPCNFGGITLGLNGELVKCIKLGDLEIDNIGFIHCDSQGAENFIFSQGKEFLRKHRPVIFFENNMLYNKILYDTVVNSYPQYAEESRFDLVKYCTEELDYTIIRRFCNGQDDLLLPEMSEIDLTLFEKKIFSQNGEDGVIDKIINTLYPNPCNKYYLEFGVESGIECNTRNLRETYQWSGLCMDAHDENEHVRKEFITRENIIDLFEKYFVPRKINFLSVDVDYNDFYILAEILKYYVADIICCEYNATFLPSEDKVIIYESTGRWDGSNYFGVSLQALNHLMNKNGYTLIYCENNGVNAFFIHNKFFGKATFLNCGNVERLYKYPKYGHGPNGGHRPDTLNRCYVSSEMAMNLDNKIKFPKHIYMCYKDKESIQHKKVQWETLNPGYIVHLYDNNDCEQFLLDYYGETHRNIFLFLEDGSIKSDFWRICVTNKFGGIYVDADIEPSFL